MTVHLPFAIQNAIRICVCFLVCLLATLPAIAADEVAEKFFRDQVVPILQQRCVSCHNDVDRKGSFSVQRRDEVLESGYVDAGEPHQSEFLKVLRSVDGQRPRMPKNDEPLKSDEIEVLRRWIVGGAAWPDGFTIDEPVIKDLEWWSFKPLMRPRVPPFTAGSSEQAWIRTPIDAFILKTLRDQTLHPSPEADRRTLVRRLYFDLLGLPPTPDEIERFVNDTDSRAYEHLIDRLLESPHYGERWARHWLDVVKYADTCGYDKDKLRPNAWPYRDYVIRAFNTDKPYSRFIEEQIAGDVLFPGTPDGILGLGFLAAGPWDFIGHVEVPESKIDGKVARHTDRDEMVTNTLNTFCSVTIQCCQCHNHKFDPFTQEHYYNLQSVFAAVDRADRPYDLDPQIERRRRQLDAQVLAARSALTTLEDAVKRDGGETLATIEKSISELQPKSTPQAKRPEYGYHSQIEPSADMEKWVQVDLGREVEITKVVLRPCHDEFAGIGSGFGFPVRFAVTAVPNAAEPTVLMDASARDFTNPGLAAVEVPVERTKARFIRVTAKKLAPRQNDYIFALAELQVFDQEGQNIALHAEVTSLDSIEAPVRWRRTNLTDGIWPAAADEPAVQELAEALKQRQAILDRINTPERTKERDRLQKELQSLQQELTALPAGKLVYAAATHFTPQGNFQPTKGQPRSVQLLHRGNVLQPRGAAVPGTVPIIAGADSAFNLPDGHSEAERRAALAQWITRHNNPLTWRSIVNRVWQYHFGRALADSPNDLGRMGKLPTHPELLDWLAVEFRDGQSFKELHRLIVKSAVYRQSSQHNEAAAQIDGDNRFLWRTNRRRLEAEEIRDAMLAVSGRLDSKMGGPGYFLFVLEKPEHSPHYEYHKFDPEDPASHRRSIYRFIVRSQPDPYMTTLDCADSSQSTPQRNETLTSLQALSLLNNGFSLAMSRHFAARLEKEADTVDQRVHRGVQLAIGRSPNEKERQQLTEYASEHGLANLCRVLFNLSEYVYVD